MAHCLLIIHHSLTSHIKQLRSCIMDDHLFVNLRTACSRFVTARDLTIGRFFPHFFPPPASVCCSLCTCTVIRATEDGDVLGVRGLLEQKRVWTCDVRPGTFLCLWQMTVFSPLSWPQHLLLQVHPPPLPRLGHTSWQLSHSRCFTDEKRYPPPPHPNTPPPPTPRLSSFLPLSC